MKIGIIRGSFASSAEIQNFVGLTAKNALTVFTSKNNNLWTSNKITVEKLFSPYDYFGKNRILRGITNRIFIDSHYLFGLESKLIDFDIAHCAETYYHYTQQCLNAKKKGYVKKVICTVWENIPFNNEGFIGRKQYKKRAFEEVDCFLAVTKQARDALLKEGCSNDKIRILMPGIDINFFKPSKRNGKIVLFVGRNVPEKGVSDLPTKSKDFTVKIISNTPYNLMPKIYESADIFVLPSRNTNTWKEQYGMVLLEAMASGLPIVTTGSGAITEVVGDVAIYSSASNLEATLTELINDKKELKKRGIMSRERVEKYFDSKKFSSELEKIYDQIIKTA